MLNIHRSGVHTALAWLVTHETAAVSARSVYTIQPCSMSLHTSYSALLSKSVATNESVAFE